MGSVASPSMIAGVSPRRPRSLGATRPLYERRLRSVYTPQEIARPPRGQPGNRAGGVRNSAGDDRLKFGYKTPHPPGAPHTQSKAPLAPHRRAPREFLEVGCLPPPETPLLGPHTGFAGKYNPIWPGCACFYGHVVVALFSHETAEGAVFTIPATKIGPEIKPFCSTSCRNAQ